MGEEWKTLVEKKRAEAAKTIPQGWWLSPSILESVNADADISVVDVPGKCGILTPKELEITETYDAVDLTAKMAAKELSAVEVTEAFCKRAAIAHQVVSINSVTGESRR